jgi:uracil-DNA glycosylase
MTTYPFNLHPTDPSWHECLTRGLHKMDPAYLSNLAASNNWLPGPHKIFNAFSLPLEKVNYVLFGESPYPRIESANGYAFWDAAVNNLWSETGLSKKVNRATSLRNILKMLLIAEGFLSKDKTDQHAIAELDKKTLVQTSDELFNNFLQHGILLLNATLVLQQHAPHKDARAWHPFTSELLQCLLEKRPHVSFILLGRIAKTIDALLPKGITIPKIYAEHPYNLSFITNKTVLQFFEPFHLLKQTV